MDKTGLFIFGIGLIDMLINLLKILYETIASIRSEFIRKLATNLVVNIIHYILAISAIPLPKPEQVAEISAGIHCNLHQTSAKPATICSKVVQVAEMLSSHQEHIDIITSRYKRTVFIYNNTEIFADHKLYNATNVDITVWATPTGICPEFEWLHQSLIYQSKMERLATIRKRLDF